MKLLTRVMILRIVLILLIIFLLSFPFYTIGIQFARFEVGGLVVELQYLLAGVFFILAIFADCLDKYFGRKYNLVTNNSKALDEAISKALIITTLILLAAHGFINEIIPIIIVLCDIVIATIKAEALNRGKVLMVVSTSKLETITLIVGIVLSLFYNLPFEFINIRVSAILLYFATIMAIVLAFQYYKVNKTITSENAETLN